MSIRIFYDKTNYRIRGWRNTVKLIEKVIVKEKKISGDLNFIITHDETLREINIKFLEHDYNTDVISFDYSKEKVVNGEIYISLETVRNNAINYNVSLRNELFRVIIHGVLHLIGYDDIALEQKKIMREMENKWLRLMKEQNNGFQV